MDGQKFKPFNINSIIPIPKNYVNYSANKIKS